MIPFHQPQGRPGQKRQPQLPWRLTICTTQGGAVFVKLQINHAAIDGGSLAIVVEELAAAYEANTGACSWSFI